MRVTTEADEVYVLTRFDDNSLHVERTHSSARSPKIADDDFVATGPTGGMYLADEPDNIGRGVRNMDALRPGSRIALMLDGDRQIRSAPIVTAETLFTNAPHWSDNL
jgi:hypothetical protein